MRPKLKNYFMQVTALTARLSTCQSKQVGAILVKDNRVVAIGYNGTVSGAKHCNTIDFENRDEHHNWSRYNELHAEQNLLMYCARSGIQTQDATLFITIGPCIDCAKIIVASGITTVIYLGGDYDKESGTKFLEDNNIKVIK